LSDLLGIKQITSCGMAGELMGFTAQLTSPSNTLLVFLANLCSCRDFGQYI